MAFLTSQRGAGTPSVAQAFQRADQAAVRIKASAALVRGKSQAGTVTASDILNNLVQTLRLEKSALVEAAATPGIAAYASDQYTDATGYDVGAEFAAMMGEVEATIAFFIANYPDDGSGNLTALAWTGDGSGDLVSYSGFAQAQRAAIVGRLDALLATID